MLTIKHYLVQVRRQGHRIAWGAVAIHDGWRPLGVTINTEGDLVVAAQVDTDQPEEREVFRLVGPGADLEALAQADGVELAHLGQAGELHVFLDVPLEETSLTFDGRSIPEKLPKLPPLSR